VPWFYSNPFQKSADSTEGIRNVQPEFGVNRQNPRSQHLEQGVEKRNERRQNKALKGKKAEFTGSISLRDPAFLTLEQRSYAEHSSFSIPC